LLTMDHTRLRLYFRQTEANGKANHLAGIFRPPSYLAWRLAVAARIHLNHVELSAPFLIHDVEAEQQHGVEHGRQPAREVHDFAILARCRSDRSEGDFGGVEVRVWLRRDDEALVQPLPEQPEASEGSKLPAGVDELLRQRRRAVDGQVENLAFGQLRRSDEAQPRPVDVCSRLTGDRKTRVPIPPDQT
jgi:hypothetical protein